MNKWIQAKHITDAQIIIAVRQAPNLMPTLGAHRVEVSMMFPDLPPKIVWAKLRQAVLKGILRGCKSDVCARRGRCDEGCPDGYTIVDEVR